MAILASGALTLATPPVSAVAAVPPPTGVALRQASVSTVTDTSTDFARHPELAIVSPMAPWQAIEPQDDVFDFTQLDLDVQDAAANGYLLLVRIMSGRLSPGWLPAAGVQTLRLLGTDDNAHDYCDRIDVPLPWDPILAQEYREMLAAFGAWAAAPDGLGGTNADHLYVVPISMPAILGSEMQIGNGSSVTCPSGTDGAGQNLAGVNGAAWDTLGTTAQRRAWVAGAWRDAIDIHMDELPAGVRSIIAWGGIFGDGHAAALDLARTEIGPHRTRLWSMFTNLQPLSNGNQITGVWKDWCPACHDVIMAALEAGGTVGFQVAGTERMDTGPEFHAAVDDALARYTPRFIEGSVAAVDREAAYLLTDPDPVRDRLAALAGQVLSTTSMACTTAPVGDPATCIATVSELWDDPALVAGGEVTWSSSADPSPVTCLLDGSGACTVTVTPSTPGATPVMAAYAGDAAHRPSGTTGEVQTATRPVTVTTSCQTPVVVGHAATCTAAVADADATTPTGSVTWEAAGAGSLGASTCALAGGGGTGSCGVTFTPSGLGTSYVTATYDGTAVHDGGVATASVVAVARATSVTVTCPTGSVAVGSTATCTATVADTSGGGSPPGGVVTWSSASVGSFPAGTSCTPAGTGGTRSCAVGYMPSMAGTHVVQATYEGDAVHEGSQASGTLVAVVPDTTPPTVQITSPANGATIAKGKTLTITATAGDAGGVARVEFRVGGTLTCTDTAAPFSCAWAVPKKANVTYTIAATARDAAGNTATATITVRAR